MNTRKIKRAISARVRNGEDFHDLIAPLPRHLKLAVLEYIELKGLDG